MVSANKRHVAWAMENVPLLRARGEDVVVKMVARANEDTQTARVLISIATVTLTIAAAWYIEKELRAGDSTPISVVVTTVIVGSLLTYVGSIASAALLHKRIVELANG